MSGSGRGSLACERVGREEAQAAQRQQPSFDAADKPRK